MFTFFIYNFSTLQLASFHQSKQKLPFVIIETSIQPTIFLQLVRSLEQKINKEKNYGDLSHINLNKIKNPIL